MGTTTNYSWPYPEATGLVKDGWEDIKDLATSIDTTAAASFGGGLKKLSTQTFSAASSVSFANNTFTSTYTNYFFTFNITTTAGNATNFRARVRASGTDNTSANYSFANWEGTGPSVSASVQTGVTSWVLGPIRDVDARRTTFDFFLTNVQKSGRYTAGHATGLSDMDATIYPLKRNVGLNVTTSYDSITFFPESGTISGTITCYGFAE